MDCNIKGKMCGPESALYGLGFLGALFYYVTTAPSIFEGVIGVVKTVFWPAFLVYGALGFMGI